MKTKTNREIIKEFEEKWLLDWWPDKDDLHSMSDFKDFILKALQAKDEKIKLWKVKFEALKEVSDAIEEDLRREIQAKDEQARLEKIELVESCPNEVIYGKTEEKSEGHYVVKGEINLQAIGEWKTEKLNQLKDGNE